MEAGWEGLGSVGEGIAQGQEAALEHFGPQAPAVGKTREDAGLPRQLRQILAGLAQLGAAEPEAIAAVARVVGTRRPWTMACGELGGDAADESVAGSIRSRFDRMLHSWGALRCRPQP